jgi:hypothetical protein
MREMGVHRDFKPRVPRPLLMGLAITLTYLFAGRSPTLAAIDAGVRCRSIHPLRSHLVLVRASAAPTGRGEEAVAGPVRLPCQKRPKSLHDRQRRGFLEIPEIRD